MPQNLTKDDEVIFRHEATCDIKPCFLLEIKNLYYRGTGLVQVSRYRKLPLDFLLYNLIQRLPVVRFLFYLFKQRFTRKMQTIKEPVSFVVDQWSYGYFHWMAEVLPRLIVANTAISDSSVILPAKYKNLSFVEASLNQLNIKFQFLNEKKIYHLRNVHFISHFAPSGNFNDEWIKKLRLMLQPDDEDLTTQKLIYISRKLAGKRCVINEEEILPLLASLNFKIVFTEDLSFVEQQTLFAAATVIVSNHGAGLTNMLFMKAGTKVVEIRNAADTHNNCYFSLASSLNIDYYYCKAQPVNPAEDFHTANLVVDKTKLNELLNSVLKTNKDGL